MKKTFQVLAAVLLAAMCWGQSTNQGAIAGTVTDPSGAVVSGVQITVRNIDTGTTRNLATTSDGDYHVDFLAPGKYEVAAQAVGFQRLTITDLTLTVGQLLRVNVKMTVGAVNQEVTVSSTTAAINTDSAELGNVVPASAINDLPLNGREWLSLASLAPGAQTGNDNRRGVYGSKGAASYGGPGQASAVGFNGARSNYNGYYVDGADSTDPWYNTLASSPSLDAVKEFRVQTNMYGAQYGRSAGAVLSVVTKSGTNAYHGSLYEFHRNKALDALPYFFTGTKKDLPNYLFNQYGGTVGGPIRKNKTFFFFSLERFYEAKPSQQLVGFVPTALEAQGDVSQTINPYSGQPVVLTNPYTGQPIPGNKLTPDLINPVGQKIMDIWAQNKPNNADPFLNWRGVRGGSFKQKKYLVRIDHNFNERNSLFGTFDFNRYDNDNPGDTVYTDKTEQEHNKSVSVTYTHTFLPTLVNDLKFSGTWYRSGDAFKLADKNYGADWGFFPDYNTLKGTPRILMFGVADNYFSIGNSGPYNHTNRTFYVRDNLSWAKGSHSFTFGGDFRRQDFGWQYESGTAAYYFGLADGDPGSADDYLTSGSTFTDVLMGLPNYVYIGLGGTNMPLFRNAFSLFGQDDWKVSQKFTLNIGLRYDYESPFTSGNHEFMTVDYNTGLPWYAKGAPADKLAGLSFPFEKNGPNTAYYARWRNFAPRIGFAWKPFGGTRTVVRGGYGMFYTSENAVTTMQNTWVSPFNGIFSWYPKSFFWADGQDHWSTVDQPLYNYAQVRDSGPGYFSTTNPYYPTGYIQQYNFTISRDLGWRTALDLGWVGSKGTNLNGRSDFPPDLLQKLAANGVNNISPYIYDDKGYNSKYNSLQVNVRKDMSNGIFLLAAYTWGHSLAQASNDETNYATRNILDPNDFATVHVRTYDNADFDVRHRLSLSGGWELPFGRGKKFGSSWTPVLDGILGGFQFNYIATFQSGFSFPVLTSAYARPDRVCNGNLPASQRTADKWFDFNCFVARPPEVVTNPLTGQPVTINPEGNSPGNIIVGPGITNFDLGVQKIFRVTERAGFQFRAEMFNAFNHPNLIGPSEIFFNTASGAKINQARDPRDIQFALKFLF